MKYTTGLTLSLVAGFALAINASAPSTAQAETRMSVATGSSGGVYYLWGGALAQIWTNAVDDHRFNVEATTGQAPNVRLLEAGDVEIGMFNIATAYEAWNQMNEYDDREYRNQRALFAMYPSYYVMTSLADSGIGSIEDWEGRNITLGTAGGTVDIMGRYILDSLGIEPAQIQNSGWPDVPSQMRDGLVDAIGAIGGQPWPPIADLESTHDLVFYDFTEEQMETLQADYPYFVDENLPDGTYRDQPDDYASLAFWNLALANVNVDEDVVYAILESTFENIDQIRDTHPSTAEFLDAENVLRVSPVPLHAGAVRYYQDQGFDVPEELIAD